MTVNLGMPAPPPPVLAPRRKTRQIQVGKVGVGGDAPVSVQSMTTTLTADVNATLQQIAELTASGCDIVRVACPSQDDADALPAIAQQVADPGDRRHPLPAEVRLRRDRRRLRRPSASTRATSASSTTRSRRSPQAAKDAGISLRIGVNAGSLDKRLLEKYGKATPEALVESAVWEASLFEEHDFHDFKISVKHNDPVVMVRAYELLAERGDWPLHLGVTEAGPAFQGTIKSAIAFGALLSQGHRRHDPRLAVRAAGRGGQGRHPDPAVAQPAPAQARDRLLPVLRPGPGRRLQARRRGHRRARGLEVPLRVAVMGCVVNGPGEAREADLGVASGNGKGQIFVKGEVIKTVPESQIVETLIEEAMRIAEEMGEAAPEGPPVVSVS